MIRSCTGSYKLLAPITLPRHAYQDCWYGQHWLLHCDWVWPPSADPAFFSYWGVVMRTHPPYTFWTSAWLLICLRLRVRQLLPRLSLLQLLQLLPRLLPLLRLLQLLSKTTTTTRAATTAITMIAENPAMTTATTTSGVQLLLRIRMMQLLQLLRPLRILKQLPLLRVMQLQQLLPRLLQLLPRLITQAEKGQSIHISTSKLHEKQKWLECWLEHLI